MYYYNVSISLLLLPLSLSFSLSLSPSLPPSLSLSLPSLYLSYNIAASVLSVLYIFHYTYTVDVDNICRIFHSILNKIQHQEDIVSDYYTLKGKLINQRLLLISAQCR